MSTEKTVNQDTKNNELGGLTYEQLVIACSNIGYDLTCGACASLFYTGYGVYPHTSSCFSQPSKEE